MKTEFRFIDLFSGLGGFHLAAKESGGRCVFASELDCDLRDLYHLNFGIRPEGDLNDVEISSIPEHELLCAGFPCQPFSKAGSQFGWKDAVRGTLFFLIAKIIEEKKPKLVFLENVANFLKHDRGNTFKQVVNTLEQLGYDVMSAKLSPHVYGVPQHRERMYIVARLRSEGGLSGFSWPVPDNSDTDIRSVLEAEPTAIKPLPPHIPACLEMWQEFLELIPESSDLPSFPIWSMEAGATYPVVKPIGDYEAEELWGYRGKYGKSLDGLSMEEIRSSLPSHALRESGFPRWKVSFIERNRNFFQKHEALLSSWLERVQMYPSSFQKMEWNDKNGPRDIYQHLVQVRASGVRVKRAAYSPALVSSSDSQIPIVPWLGRYLSVKECARLQCMESLVMPSYIYDAYKALGNAVNVKVVALVLEQLLGVGVKLGGEKSVCSETKSLQEYA
jgi:DNA (cytosine-5)-methyltransferase 1